MSGWVKTYRNLIEMDLWTMEKFSKGHALIDLRLMASFKPSHIWIRGIKVVVKKGEICASIETLGRRWFWSRNKVNKFLKDIEDLKLIEISKNNVCQVIRILDYDSDPLGDTSKDFSKGSTEGISKGSTEGATEGATEGEHSKKERTKELKNIKDIVVHLNESTGKNFNYKTKSTITKINARLNEGYTVDQLKTVIDIKTCEWLGTDNVKYLRPETLFGNKFDSYLNSEGKADETTRKAHQQNDPRSEGNGKETRKPRMSLVQGVVKGY